MKASPLTIADVLLIEPQVFVDGRGFFFESFNQRQLETVVGRLAHFVQDNHSRSIKHVLRGLHYQIGRPQAKLIQVIVGEVFDVVVDIRRRSPTFGKWAGVMLSGEEKRQVWVPEGFAHGFVVTSDVADVLYKTTDYWAPEYERCIAWDDPTLNIDWRLNGSMPVLSQQDRCGVAWDQAETYD